MKIEKKSWHSNNPVMWEYSVKLWDEDEKQFVLRQGVTYGRSYVEAMMNVDFSYGDYAEDIIIHSLMGSPVYDIAYDGKALTGKTISDDENNEPYDFYKNLKT